MDHLASDSDGYDALLAAAARSKQKLPVTSKDDWAALQQQREAALTPRGTSILKQLNAQADDETAAAARTAKPAATPGV
jgi:hypothetical protein